MFRRKLPADVVLKANTSEGGRVEGHMPRPIAAALIYQCMDAVERAEMRRMLNDIDKRVQEKTDG